jgi:Fic family protein
MRWPKTPPRFQNFLSVIKDPRRLGDLLQAVPEPTVRGRYLHWDKLIREPAPAGFTHEEWWLALKLHRSSPRFEVPLRDKNGQPFTCALVDPIPERLHAIDLGAGGQIGMVDQVTNPETRDRYYVGSLVEEAITSSQLEGAVTTRLVAKELLRTGRKPRDRSEQMILNNYQTMRRIGQLRKEALSPELVFEIHRLMTDRTLDDVSAAGRFRRVEEDINIADNYGEVFHTPPSADALPERLEALCDFANGKTPARFIHPAIRAIVLHFWLAYDHPFVDGNGRTARALFYWSMLRHRFWLFEFVSISPILLRAPMQYYRAFLYTETDANDLTYFVLYHLDVLRRAVEQLHRYIERKTTQIQTLEAQLRGLADLNYRQRALISHALRHPGHRYTIESYRRSHDVVYETARTDLLDLQRRGFMQTQRRGRALVFTAVAGLEQRLGAPA